ncbi:ammonium transporter Rh type A-like [Littorina saxatilis]|uniref:Ammonium transporter AmtB-like domain-containing protein n=1 Tax=Littorina saxatilis TaxID=31220 RepID=A0AAN9GF20_9CAEN
MSRRGVKFGAFVFVCQLVFLLLFAFLAKYDDTAQPKDTDPTNMVAQYYPMFQDVHVMMFIGFGFLMTFLKLYGYSAVGVNMLVAAFVLQVALIVRGFIHSDIAGGERFPINITEMLSSDFAAATVLISFGAVLGKTSPLQLLIMAIIETILAQLNEYTGVHKLHTSDIGESMYVHVFGAYFGLAVARVLYSEETEENSKEGAVYHSDIFAMIGCVFLWLYWPSFNGGATSGDEQHRAVINTYLSLAACTIVTFAISAMLDNKGRFDMVHIQNATLAGGVAVGTTADMPLEPWGAVLMGTVAAIISVVGYKYITPALTRFLKLHDTCGVHNLHGMPGVLAGIAGAVMAALSTRDKWGESLCEIFPARAGMNATIPCDADLAMTRTALEQGGYQMAALCMTLVIAIVGGALTGLLLKLPIWDAPQGDMVFDDHANWEVSDYNFPQVMGDKGRSNGETDSNTRV